MPTTVLRWLEDSAARHPDKVAVADAQTSRSFRELHDDACRAGSWIAARVAPRQAVALYLEKSPATLAIMLGAAAAGCFYSVIDIRQSAPRVHAIAKALEAPVVVTSEDLAEEARSLFGALGVEVALADELIACPLDQGMLASRRAQATDVDPLYVNFTSGSTGTPKGVVVSHRSVIDFVPELVRTFHIASDDVIANQAPFDFDVSVKDIYAALMTGATLRLVPRELFSRPAELMDYLADGEATVLIWAVSALCFVSIMNGLDYRTPTTVRLVMFSGEVMPPKQLAVWRRALPDAMYVNLYGPTEITCNCTYHVVDRDYAPDETIPMGRPFANERVFLLDDSDREVCAEGVEGEVCVSGTALALGYLGSPERTAAAFVQNPLNGRWLEPIYRTGDLARYDERGDLVYCSRKDHQIKHLGQRIELGDIEAAAQACTGVEQAVCLYDSRRKRLHLAYVGPCAKEALAERLGIALPHFMVPNRIHPLDQLPLTKNGKVDRAALEVSLRIRR